MDYPRRFLPPMPLLCAFEAAARLQNFTAAAQELHLTQGAVSRQIRALEALVGTPLFVRERQTVRLTLAGESYAREVRESLRRVAGATLGFRANPTGGSLNLAVPPTFARQWLIPHLPAFLQENPALTVNLVTRLRQVDFREESVDAAIQWGHTDRPAIQWEPFMTESVMPVCSPALRLRHGLATAEDLRMAPLLHLDAWPDGWEHWFYAQGIEVGKLHGMLLDDYTLAAEAAMAGLGVALLPPAFFGDLLRRRRLVRACQVRPFKAPHAYGLAWPADRSGYRPLMQLRDWLRQAGASTARAIA